MAYSADNHEKDILAYWKEHNCFEKSVQNRSENKPYVFYDGPPFATGLPHYGHILSSVIKDVVPRYWTMKGYQVKRRWGWDCHGLPIENIIEKELNISGKKSIEASIGVEGFNEACRTQVLTYTKEWKQMVDRIGRWVEFDNAYKTMDTTYMESVWWALKTMWQKDLIYEGYKVLMYCPRCETPVSKAEIAMDNSYKDITEESAIAKFKLLNPEKLSLPADTYVLAWTTTPWTLPGNVALAVGAEIEYIAVQLAENSDALILAKDRADDVLYEKEYTVLATISGADLVNLSYEPLYPLQAVTDTGKKAWYIAAADFVSTADGTGIVHTAVMYGEDDFNLGKQIDLPMVPLLDEMGHFVAAAPEFIVGEYFKKAEKSIKRDLEERGLLFAREQYTHSYPHCWRCDTALYYNAVSAWFINIQKVKDKAIALNEKINWYPDHLKHGRFLNILETAPDWNISRNRYWATALPFWRCDNDACDHVTCVGSIEELAQKAQNFAEVFSSTDVSDVDLHKHNVDKIYLTCEKCDARMTRIPEVIDCWLEASAMPFAEWHYPFENKETVEARMPGQFIAEYISQTRAWFYYMHMISVLLFDNNSFEHCVTTGTILNEKGEKLSKSKRNFTDPWIIIEQYGMDALRYYLMTSVVMQAENLFFNDREVRDVYNKIINLTWNVVTFYEMFKSEYDGSVAAKDSTHVLDQWILARLHELLREVTTHMDEYNTVKAGRPIKDFIADLSQWYVRRSRDRFKGTDTHDKQAAIATLREVLLTLSQIMALFTPFIAEKMYLLVSDAPAGESVHLTDWPAYDENLLLLKVGVLEDMADTRSICEAGNAARKDAKISVRQALSTLHYWSRKPSFGEQQHQSIIMEELNVKKVIALDHAKSILDHQKEKELEKNLIFSENQRARVWLDTQLTDELLKDGMVREIVRSINSLRKMKHLTREDRIAIVYSTDSSVLTDVMTTSHDDIASQVHADSIVSGSAEHEFEVQGEKIFFDF